MNENCPKCREEGKKGYLSVTFEGTLLMVSCTTKGCNYKTAMPDRRLRNVRVEIDRRAK
jgi:hypothetical protein